MPNLKDLKTRINSVKSTQKITSAMKMVAAAKLRRAQEAAESGRPYAARMSAVIASLATKTDRSSASPLLVGRADDKTHLLVIMSADKGLCGGFNGSIARTARKLIAEKQASGHKVLVYVVGRKAGVSLGSEIADIVFSRIEGVQGSHMTFGNASEIGQKIIDQAVIVLEEVAKIKDLSANGDKQLNLPFKLGLIYSIAPYLLPKIIPNLRKHTPNMPLEIHENITKNLENGYQKIYDRHYKDLLPDHIR